MGFALTGNGGINAEVSTTHRALRMEPRPLDYGSLGSYSAAHLSGTMAAGLASNSEIFQFRWTHASNLAAITEVLISGVSGSSTAFAAGFGNLSLTAARSWSVDGSGGTAMTVTGNNQKLRTSMGTISSGTSIRGSSTAALGAGTKTFDSQAIGNYSFAVSTAASSQLVDRVSLYRADENLSMPIILATNEGIAVRATVPATGTWQFAIIVRWTELTAY